jgi:hypothetical protein
MTIRVNILIHCKREGYHLQPTKSVVLPVKSMCKSMEINEGQNKCSYDGHGGLRMKGIFSM